MGTPSVGFSGMPHSSTRSRPRSNSDSVLDTAGRVTQTARPVVQAVQGPVSVGGLQGRAQAVQATLPASALAAQNAATRVQVRQATPQTTATAERLPSKVRVATEYHGTSCEVSRNKENQAELDRAGELFLEMREHLLSTRAITPEAALTLEVKLNQAILRYEEDGVMKVIDLVKTQDPNCKRIFEEMRSLFPARRPQFIENGKGNIAGCMPARRCNAVLQQMPSRVSDPNCRKAVEAMIEPSFSPEQKSLAKTRMDALEKYHGAALECLNKQIQQKQAVKAALQPTDVDQDRELQKQIKELQRMRQELQDLDAFAVMTALSFLPKTIDDRGEISRQAEAARAAVEQYYRKEHQERAADIQDPHRHDFFLKRAGYAIKEAFSPLPRPELGTYSDEFAGDVAGFLFASSPEARRDYQTYCMQHDLDMKQESLEDAFVREMARCVNSPDAFDPKTAFQTWMAGLDGDSKQAMEGNLQAAHTAWKASLASPPASTASP